MVLLIKSTSRQQDKAEQLDGTTHDTDGGGFKIKSLSAHSINKIWIFHNWICTKSLVNDTFSLLYMILSYMNISFFIL